MNGGCCSGGRIEGRSGGREDNVKTELSKVLLMLVGDPPKGQVLRWHRLCPGLTGTKLQPEL